MQLTDARLTRRTFIAASALLVVSVGFSQIGLTKPAFAITAAEAQAQANTARATLNNLMSQLEVASDNYYTALDEHDAAVAAMNEAQGRIDAAEAIIASAQDKLSSRAVSMYKNGSVSYLDVLLGATSFTDFTNTWDILNMLNEEDNELIEQTNAAKADAEAARKDYAEQAQIAQQKLNEAAVAQTELQKSVDSYKQTVANLDAEVASLIAQEQAAEEAASQAAAQAALAASRASSSSSDTNSSSDDSSSAPSGNYGADYDGNNEIVSAAYSRVGSEYTQASGRRNGPWSFDCSGLTQWCYAQVGISIPGTSSTQYAGMQHISLSNAVPGDVLWKSGHVGIYAGDNTYVHASDYGVGVIVSKGISTFSCALRPY
jgi:peptidoglycan DL-endopeptidase CwlO